MVSDIQAYNYAGTQAYTQMPNFAPTMAYDFFGSQIFGGNTEPQQTTYAEPTNAASAVLQQYMYANTAPQENTGYGPATINDYAMATQIAGMFKNNTPMLFPNSSFVTNDIFAQQVFPPFSMNNGQAIA